MKIKPFTLVLLTFALTISGLFVSTPLVTAQSELDWTDPINLSNSGSSTDPLVVTDTDGVIHVIWVDEFEGYKYVESVNGVDWTTPVTVNFPFLPETEPPRFEVTANGIIHVFWRDDENTLYYAQSLQATFDTPISWRSQARLGNSIVDYDVAAGTTNGLHVSLITNEGSDNETAGVYYRGSLNGGVSWSGMVSLFESPYFRSLTKENAHVRLAVSNNAEIENVYVVWDNLALKRIFMMKSSDRGLTWDDSSEIIGPEINSGYETPYNVEIGTLATGVLLTWQTGESGIRCAQYSRWSDNGGIDWGETVSMFDGLGVCPERIGFNVINGDYAVVVLNIEESLAMIAWNGNTWSTLQLQSGLLSLSNPVTFDPILFHCQHISLKNEQLIAVGCDDGASKDIWLSSRLLGTVESWFPPPSDWISPQEIVTVPQQISSISSVADSNNNIHAVWVQSELLDNEVDSAIYYALWNGDKWSDPAQIIINLRGHPVDLSLATDNLGRLLLVWVDEKNGDLLFSWANSGRANIPLEWTPSTILPSPARLIGSPDVLVDGSGNIVVAYAITLNENRGIYMVQSNDFGETWSVPSLIFDAVSAEWDAIDHPRIALTIDGRLHVVFSKYLVSGEIHPMGLFYSQSEDGGVNWNDPKEISDNPVYWSRIIADHDRALHLVWQEINGESIVINNGISTDSGLTWNNPMVVTSTRNKFVLSDSMMDISGQLHLIQVSGDDALGIQEWTWDGSRWNLGKDKSIFNNMEGALPQEFLAVVTPDGFLSVLAILEMREADNILGNSLIGSGRHLEIVSSDQVSHPAVLPTPPLLIDQTTAPEVNLTPTISSPLIGVNNPTPVNRNAVGLIMVVVILIIVVIVIRPRRSIKGK
jgi:hypothetical protein